MLGVPGPSRMAGTPANLTPHCKRNLLDMNAGWLPAHHALQVATGSAMTADRPTLHGNWHSGPGTHPPMGSPMEASKPAETMMRSGWYS